MKNLSWSCHFIVSFLAQIVTSDLRDIKLSPGWKHRDQYYRTFIIKSSKGSCVLPITAWAKFPKLCRASAYTQWPCAIGCPDAEPCDKSIRDKNTMKAMIQIPWFTIFSFLFFCKTKTPGKKIIINEQFYLYSSFGKVRVGRFRKSEK